MFGEIKYLPYSPDWKRDMSKDDFVVQVCHILQTINAVVAPHQIVIYQERVEREELDLAWKQYGKDHPMPSLPEIVHQDSFQHDFDAAGWNGASGVEVRHSIRSLITHRSCLWLLFYKLTLVEEDL